MVAILPANKSWFRGNSNRLPTPANRTFDQLQTLVLLKVTIAPSACQTDRIPAWSCKLQTAQVPCSLLTNTGTVTLNTPGCGRVVSRPFHFTVHSHLNIRRTMSLSNLQIVKLGGSYIFRNILECGPLKVNRSVKTV
jgi:hypothetical protein